MVRSAQDASQFRFNAMIFLLLIAGASLPAQVWGIVAFSKNPPPFLPYAFSLSTEIVLHSLISVAALLLAWSMYKRSGITPIVGLICLGGFTIYTIAETTLTYKSKMYYPGPKYSSLAQAAIATIGCAAFSVYLFRYGFGKRKTS
jgi:hypothetical protein